MTSDIICHYVPYADVPEWTALGWEPDGSGPLYAPHGFFSVMLTWMGKGEPVEPPKPIHNDSIPAKSEAAQ